MCFFARLSSFGWSCTLYSIMPTDSCHHHSKDSIVAFIAMIWRSCVAFSPIRRFHCCHFIAGVTVPAEVVNHATAFDTIHHDPLPRRWDPRPQDAYHSAPKPPQRRFSFVSNKLIRGAVRPLSGYGIGRGVPRGSILGPQL